jgi:hypothetical protein
METQAMIRYAFSEGNMSDGDKGKAQSQEHVHSFIIDQGRCSQRIHSGKPNSQFCMLQ